MTENGALEEKGEGEDGKGGRQKEKYKKEENKSELRDKEKQ